MADKKISELVSLAGKDVAATDLFPVVDVSVTETKSLTRDELRNAVNAIQFAATKALATTAAASLPDDTIIEVAADESLSDARTRYKVAAGGLVFAYGVATQAELDAASADLADASDPAKGAALVGFLPAGTGAVARSVRDKLLESVSVTDFAGVDLTGVTDSAAGIQKALDSGAKIVRIPAGVYKINQTLTIPKDVSIEGDGAGSTMLDGSGAAFASLSDGYHIRTQAATWTALPALAADPKKGDRTLLFASAPALLPGDIIQLYNPTDYSFSGHRAYYREGEYVRVALVSGANITLQDGLFSNYSAASLNTYRLDGATSCRLRGFCVKGKSGAGGAVTGINLINAVDSVIEDVRVINASYAQVCVNQCYNVRISGLTCEEDFSSDYGGDYGFIISNSQNVDVTGGKYAAARHGSVTGGGTGVGCVPVRNIHFKGGVFSGISQAAFNLHGNAEYCSVSGATIDGGATLAGDHIICDGNLFKGKYAQEVCILVSECSGANFTITNNDMENDGFPAGNTLAAFISLGAGGTAIGAETYRGGVVKISGNTGVWTTPGTLAAAKPLVVSNYNYAGSEDIDCHITNNAFISKSGHRLGLLVVNCALAAAKPWTTVNVSNNTSIDGFSISVTHSVSGYYCAEKVIISGNVISKAFAIGVRIIGAKEYISVNGNHISKCGGQPVEASGHVSGNCRHIDISSNTMIDNLANGQTSSVYAAQINISSGDSAVIRNNVSESYNELIGVSSGTGFVIGETIVGATSGATAIVKTSFSTTRLGLERTRSGVFVVGEVITGATSGATTTVTLAAFYCQTSKLFLTSVASLLVAGNIDARNNIITATGVTFAAGSILSGSATYNPPSLAAGVSGAATTVTVAGAQVGDLATATHSTGIAGYTYHAQVTAANTVTVTPQNISTAGPLDPLSGTLNVRVERV